MHTFPVRYHGSLSDHHGQYRAAWNDDCGRDHGRHLFGEDIVCLDLFDQESGRRVLRHARERSVTRLAPDGTDLHRAAQDGDLIALPHTGALVRYAYITSAHHRDWEYVHYYARSSRGWVISSTLVNRGRAVVREHYSTPAELCEWQLRMVLDEIAYRVQYPDLHEDIEAQADELEFWTQKREALDLD